MSVDSHYDKVLTAMPRLNLPGLPPLRQAVLAGLRSIRELAQEALHYAVLIVLAILIVFSLAVSYFVTLFAGKAGRRHRRRQQARDLHADPQTRQQRRRRRRQRRRALLGTGGAALHDRPRPGLMPEPDQARIHDVQHQAG